MKEKIEELYVYVDNLKQSSLSEEAYTLLDNICDKIHNILYYNK